jgi:translocation and assembly module TamB
VRFLRYAIIFILFLVAASGAAYYWAMHTTSGARFVVSKAETMAAFKVRSIDGDLAGGLELRGVSFANDSIEVSADRFAVMLNVEVFPLLVDLVETEASEIHVRLLESSSNEDAGGDIGETLRALALPVPVHFSSLQANQITVSGEGFSHRIDTLGLEGVWYEDMSIERFDVRGPGYEVGANASIDLQGGDPIKVSANAELGPELTQLPDVLPVAALVNVYPDSLDVEASLGSFAQITGRVEWSDVLSASSEILLEGWAPSDLIDTWPAERLVSGRLNVSVDEESLSLSDAYLAVDGLDMTLEAKGDFEFTSERVAGELRWQNLRWPLDAGDTGIKSDNGDLRVEGTVDDWAVGGTIALTADGLQDGEFTIDINGTRDGLEGEILESQVFGGLAAGNIAYSWVGSQPWSAALDISNLGLAGILPEWPGRLSGRVESTGTAQPFSFQARLEGIKGEVRDAPVAAEGFVDMREDGTFVARELHVSHGTSRFLLNGTPQTSQGLTFEASVNDLGAYEPTLSGAVSAAGRLVLVDPAASLVLNLESTKIGTPDFAFENVTVVVDASDAGQALRLNGVHLGTHFTLTVEGAFGDWQAPLATPFAGEVSGFQIDLEDRHTMSLAENASLQFSTEHAALQDFCITDQTGSVLCANASWKQAGDYSFNLQLDRVPVDIIEHVVSTGLQFNQQVSGSFDWWHDGVAGTGGSGAVTVSAGTVGLIDEPDSVVTTGDARLDFEIGDGRLLRGDLELPLPGRGQVSGKFGILDLTQGSASGIDGQLDVDISSIRMLSRLSPLLDSTSGAVHARVTFAGTIGDPQITGVLEVQDGRFVYLPIGLDLSEVNLHGSMDRDYNFEVSGSFRAGEGYGEIESSVGNEEMPGLFVTLRGQNLTLVNVPDVSVRVDPDIDLAIDRNSLEINGEITVPHALIKPRNLAESRVNESRDVIIVAGELPDLEVKDEEGFLTYQGKLDVTLGDDVVIELDLARANVTGSTAFEWRGPMIPIANGRYSIDGSVAAFGQVLEISEGQVNFPQVPADRPLIRISAERDIFGNTQVKRAGVRIDGPVRRPTVDTYTVPMTTEERALQLLVTGSDFDYEQGIGAIDFGTYIAPRLFVSYGVGVFERENIISARYDLSKGFGIKASSGSKESGVDLNYRFEN